MRFKEHTRDSSAKTARLTRDQLERDAYRSGQDNAYPRVIFADGAYLVIVNEDYTY